MSRSSNESAFEANNNNTEVVGTHDNTTAKVLGSIKDGLGHTRAEPFGAAGEDGEEGASHGGGEDDEDGCDAEASVGLVATAGAAVEVGVVAGEEETGVVAHFCEAVRRRWESGKRGGAMNSGVVGGSGEDL